MAMREAEGGTETGLADGLRSTHAPGRTRPFRNELRSDEGSIRNEGSHLHADYGMCLLAVARMGRQV
jgi:hypothetical protein